MTACLCEMNEFECEYDVSSWRRSGNYFKVQVFVSTCEGHFSISQSSFIIFYYRERPWSNRIQVCETKFYKTGFDSNFNIFCNHLSLLNSL